MALIKAVRGFKPKMGSDCFFAENATIIGDVVMGNHCSVWFNAVIRGDVNKIRIGDCCNIQDGAVLHCTFEQSETHLGNNVSVAHNAVVHGCTIHDNVLVGMGGIIMDHAIVESHVIVAAGAVVLSGQRLESGHIYAGTPAKKIKAVGEEQGKVFERTAQNYIKYAGWFEAE